MGRFQVIARDGRLQEIAIRTALYNRSIISYKPYPSLTQRRFRGYPARWAGKIENRPHVLRARIAKASALIEMISVAGGGIVAPR
jgi:hypothetical protein